MVCNIVCEALGVYGYNLLEAVDSIDGFRLGTGNSSIDFVLTDVIKPQMNGQELYQKVIQVQSEILVGSWSGMRVSIKRYWQPAIAQ